MTRAEPTGLKALTGDRAVPVREEGFIYLLQAPDGSKLAGQLPPMAPVEGWLDIVPPWGEEDEPWITFGATPARSLVPPGRTRCA